MEVLDTVTTEKGSGVLGVAQTLGVDPDQGLSGDPDDLEARKLHFGVNYFEPEPVGAPWTRTVPESDGSYVMRDA